MNYKHSKRIAYLAWYLLLHTHDLPAAQIQRESKYAAKTCLALGALNLVTTAQSIQEISSSHHVLHDEHDAYTAACVSGVIAVTGMAYSTSCFRRSPRTLNRRLFAAGCFTLAYGHALLAAAYMYPEHAQQLIAAGLVGTIAMGSHLLGRGYKLCRTTAQKRAEAV